MPKAKQEVKTFEIVLRGRKGDSEDDKIITTQGYSLVVNQRGDLLVCGKSANDYTMQSHKAIAAFRSGSWIQARLLTFGEEI